MEYVHSVGLSSGLLAALTWAIASFLFKKIGVSLPPLTLNLYKGVIASVVISLIFLIKGDLMTMLHREATLLLIISGVIGIGIGDSAFFASLNRLGEQRSVLIAETAAPVITIFIALIFLQEFISIYGWLGIITVLTGIYLVIHQPSSAHDEKKDQLKSGFFFALLAAICQSLGGIMSKAAFRIDDIDPLFSSLIRLTGGIAFLIFFIPIQQKGLLPVLPLTRKLAAYIVTASVIGTFGGIVFQQMAFKYTYTAAAQTLVATSSVFIIFIGMFMGIHPSKNATIGVILAILGIGILFY